MEVGEGTWIGAGSTVGNNVNICNGCMIGAGAVVIKDIDEPRTYIGVLVKMISKSKLIGGGGVYCFIRINTIEDMQFSLQLKRRAA